MAAATVGLIFHLGTSEGQDALSKAIKYFPNRAFQSGVKPAVEFSYKFWVAAGRLNLINDGIVTVLARDEADAILGLKTANRRLAARGFKSTRWIFIGDADFQNTMRAALPGKRKPS